MRPHANIKKEETMKKNLFYTMAVALMALVMVSCSDPESEGLSRITYYPVLDLSGPSTYIVAKGSTYQDPGYTATLDGNDVTSEVVVTSNVNTSKSGVYSVKYSIKNSDGIAASATRKVVVLDLNSPVEGFYLNSADSYRLRQGAEVAYGRQYEILIIDNGDGSYSVDDLLGGWYCQRAGYGTNYAMEGLIAIDEDGTVECLDNYVPGWGDGADDFEGTFDAATNTFNLKVVYAAMDFVQTWTKE
jgi:hypothetical protein